MRTYVSTIGYHETRVTRPVLRNGLDDGDTVVLVRPATEGDDRGEDAVEHVTAMLGEIAPGATVDTERVATDDFEQAVLTCSDVLRAARGTLIVNLGGGARELFLPLTVATLLHAPQVDTAFQYTDVGQSVRELPVPNLTASVPDQTIETLSAVVEGDRPSIATLAEATDRSKSTISRHVSALSDAGAVSTELHGQTKLVTPTITGRLILRARRSADREPF